MADSCCGANVRFDGLDPRYKRVLWTVIAINALMFVIEITAGHLAGSQALAGRRAGLPRRHADLRPEPGRHRPADGRAPAPPYSRA